MKNAFLATSFLIAAISAGCSNQSAPGLPPPDATSALAHTGILCPTDDEQARKSFGDAVALFDEGKLDEAKQLYLKAIELDPEYCDAMDNLGQLLRSQGNVDEAIDWYKKSIEVFPENTVAHQNLAVAYSIHGKVESAIAEFQLVSKIDPSNPEGYYGLGSIYLDLDRPQEAISQLEKAEELYEKDLSPFLTDAQYALGVAHMMLEDYAKGRDYFESVYSDMEDNPAINYNLGLCYLTPQLDNLDLAKKYFSKAQELGVELPAEVLQKLGK